MHFRLFAFIGLAGLLFVSPAAAANPGCCQEKAGKACCDMPCCKDHVVTPEANAVDVLLTMDQTVVDPAVPARQTLTVWFHRPVWVDRHVLLGRYVIEHDNDRMARGEPCTHIYAYNDQKTPVVAFHCIHLEREAATRHTVALASTGKIEQKFVEFQFAGETGAHGLPIVR